MSISNRSQVGNLTSLRPRVYEPTGRLIAHNRNNGVMLVELRLPHGSADSAVARAFVDSKIPCAVALSLGYGPRCSQMAVG